jgi:hypothetical protein
MNKAILILGSILVVVILIFVFLSFAHPKNNSRTPVAPNTPSNSAQPASSISSTAFRVTSTSPVNNATDVPLNSLISIVTNQTLSNDNVSVSFNPSIQFTKSFINNVLYVKPSEALTPSTK